VIFTDLRFLLLFACCWLSFFAVPPARRSAVLAVWGSVFYVTYAGAWAILVVALVVSVVYFATIGKNQFYSLLDTVSGVFDTIGNNYLRK